MKKLVFVAIILVGSIHYTQAQELNVLEIGMRFGNTDVSIDATLPLAAKPRLHPSFYFGDGGVTLGAYFDWLFGIEDLEGLKVYPGVGPEIYFYNDVNVGIAGNFGIEYSFPFPLTIGFDWRPSIPIVSNTDLYPDNWGIMARFRIN